MIYWSGTGRWLQSVEKEISLAHYEDEAVIGIASILHKLNKNFENKTVGIR